MPDWLFWLILWWEAWSVSHLFWMKRAGKKFNSVLEAVICFLLVGFTPILALIFIVRKR